MKQTIYVVKAEARGDEFTGTVTLNKGTAIKNAMADWDHLTKKEKESQRVYVASYVVDMLNDENIQETYDRLVDECDESILNGGIEWDSDDLNDGVGDDE